MRGSVEVVVDISALTHCCGKVKQTVMNALKRDTSIKRVEVPSCKCKREDKLAEGCINDLSRSLAVKRVLELVWYEDYRDRMLNDIRSRGLHSVLLRVAGEELRKGWEPGRLRVEVDNDIHVVLLALGKLLSGSHVRVYTEDSQLIERLRLVQDEVGGSKLTLSTCFNS
jgi:hypothetical protein